jgi:quercetin dioxygenase-like cupin family protein
MQILSLSDAPAADAARFIAVPFAEGSHSNARLIRLAPGQALPPHTHGDSDLMLYAVEGEATLDTDDGAVPLAAGQLAVLRGTEELRAANGGTTVVTLLAFLAPPFPPRS